jgi:hypothetical protein
VELDRREFCLMEFSQQHISAFYVYRSKGYKFDSMSVEHLAALSEDPNIKKAIDDWQRTAETARAAEQARAARQTAVATLPAPSGLIEDGKDGLDNWIKQNATCAAPVSFVAAVWHAFLDHLKANTENNIERNTRLDALEARTKQIDTLDLAARVETLEAMVKDRVLLSDAGGLFDPQKTYRRGDVCQRDGSSWIATVDGPRAVPGNGGGDWRLFALRGARGKDAR